MAQDWIDMLQGYIHGHNEGRQYQLEVNRSRIVMSRDSWSWEEYIRCTIGYMIPATRRGRRARYYGDASQPFAICPGWSDAFLVDPTLRIVTIAHLWWTAPYSRWYSAMRRWLPPGLTPVYVDGDRWNRQQLYLKARGTYTLWRQGVQISVPRDEPPLLLNPEPCRRVVCTPKSIEAVRRVRKILESVFGQHEKIRVSGDTVNHPWFGADALQALYEREPHEILIANVMGWYHNSDHEYDPVMHLRVLSLSWNPNLSWNRNLDRGGIALDKAILTIQAEVRKQFAVPVFE